ncbi:hypothetical protein SRHO_G00291910 [Serrasalmus rhombeus]
MRTAAQEGDRRDRGVFFFCLFFSSFFLTMSWPYFVVDLAPGLCGHSFLCTLPIHAWTCLSIKRFDFPAPRAGLHVTAKRRLWLLLFGPRTGQRCARRLTPPSSSDMQWTAAPSQSPLAAK